MTHNHGIYLIYSPFFAVRYVGQSTNIERRWAEHRRALANGSHHNRDLQDRIERPHFRVICRCPKWQLDGKEMLFATCLSNVRQNRPRLTWWTLTQAIVPGSALGKTVAAAALARLLLEVLP